MLFFTRGRRERKLGQCTTLALPPAAHTDWLQFTSATVLGGYPSPVISSILRSPLHPRLPCPQWPLLAFLQGLRPWHYTRPQELSKMPPIIQPLWPQNYYHVDNYYILPSSAASLRCNIQPLEHSFFVLTLGKCFWLCQINHRRFHLSGANVYQSQLTLKTERQRESTINKHTKVLRQTS